MKVLKHSTFKSNRRVRGERKARRDAQLAQTHPARAATWLALAHRLRNEIEAGVYDDMTECAHTHGLSKARLSQIFALLYLAPDIQEEVLRLRYPAGWQAISEDRLRRIAMELVWAKQRVVWRRLTE